jgi:DNA-binding MarR family transcriptional regulator
MSISLSSSQALKLLSDVTTQCVVLGEADLSFRQLAVLLEIYLKPPPFSVTLIASQLRVNKPVITRALDALGKLDLVERSRDPRDNRKLILKRTVAGAMYIDRLASRFVDFGKALPAHNVVFFQTTPLDVLDIEVLARAS